MLESKVTERSGIVTEELTQTAREREALLAALAATLVEYQRHVDCETDNGEARSGGGNWRTLARWEQLLGQA